MKIYQCSQEQFFKDVSSHKMNVIRDDGIHRHIRFKRPESSTYWFEIVTYPGALVIDGDMGTYVFKRLDDMFEFFRTDREYLERNGIELAINPGYWGEKLASVSVYGEGFKAFNEDMFREAVKSRFDAWVESEEPSEETKAELWDELDDRVLYVAEEGIHEAVKAAMDFEPDDSEVLFDMRDFFEHRLEDFTFHYIWNCYAIAWAVKQYDLITTVKESA